MAKRHCELSAQGVKNRGVVADIGLRVRNAGTFGAREGGDDAVLGLIDFAEEPKRPGQRERRRACVLARRPGGQFQGLVARIELFDGLFDSGAGIDDPAHEQEDHRPPAHRVEQRRAVVARFGEVEQSGDGFVRMRQLAANDARGNEPEHDLEIFRQIAKPPAQFLGAGECRHRRTGRRTLRGNQARRERETKIKLDPVAGRIFRKTADNGSDAALEVRDRFIFADRAAAFLPARSQYSTASPISPASVRWSASVSGSASAMS